MKEEVCFREGMENENEKAERIGSFPKEGGGERADFLEGGKKGEEKERREREEERGEKKEGRRERGYLGGFFIGLWEGGKEKGEGN